MFDPFDRVPDLNVFVTGCQCEEEAVLQAEARLSFPMMEVLE